MATTAIWDVTDRLDRIINYATNPQKTEKSDDSLPDFQGLQDVLDYTQQDSKTEKQLYVTGVNCDPATACGQMKRTKRQFNKMDGILAYHGYQAFAPGEATPEMAHAIGVKLAQELWGGRFEVVVSTHLDKSHLHNHFVINSVSFVDGKRYYDNNASYALMRKTSDRLCRENQLSIIENPKGKGKHYAEWKAEHEGKPTIRSIVRQEVDQIIRDSYNFKTFVELLQKRGYTVKYGERVKHMAVKPPYSEKYIRLKSLGDNYTEEYIALRLEAQRKGIRPLDTLERNPPKRYKLAKGTFHILKTKKIKGFAALYLRYLYMLGKVKKRKMPNKASSALREEVLKFERYQRQFRFLHANQIATKTDLINKKLALEEEMSEMTAERGGLYVQKKSADTEEIKSAIQERITAVNVRLRELRKHKRLCDSIENDINIIAQKLHQTDELTENKNIVKEEQNYEHKR